MPQPVLARKGVLRRAKNRRALARSAPWWRVQISDGRLRRDHEAEAGHVGFRPTTPEYTECVTHPILQNLTNTTERPARRTIRWASAGHHLGGRVGRAVRFNIASSINRCLI
jgi:hypothetical protein